MAGRPENMNNSGEEVIHGTKDILHCGCYGPDPGEVIRPCCCSKNERRGKQAINDLVRLQRKPENRYLRNQIFLRPTF